MRTEKLPMAVPLTAAGVMTVTLALMAPASTGGLGPGGGLLFHALHFVPATLAAWWLSCRLLALKHLDRWPAVGVLSLAGALVGVGLAPWSLVLEQGFNVADNGGDLGLSSPAGLSSAWMGLVDECSAVIPQTMLLWPLMNAPALGWPWSHRRDPQPIAALGDGSSTEAAAGVQLVAGPAPAWLDRLPVAMGRDLVLVRAEEHYLHVITTQGEAMVLHGFGRAVEELAAAGIEGIQVHRSAWVAWAHVQRLSKRAGETRVHLADGQAVRVGRRRSRAVQEAWNSRSTPDRPRHPGH